MGTLRTSVVKGIVGIHWRADEEWHEGLMRVDRERFCEEIGKVVGALAP